MEYFVKNREINSVAVIAFAVVRFN